MRPSPAIRIARPVIQRHGPGLVTTDISEAGTGLDLDPFLIVSLYEMTGPTFPPHPHAGFSVATYILPESPIGFVNQDTLGNRNRIAPGALHVTVAGRGVQHEEQPEHPGAAARGFQIWMDHPAALREIAPHALHLKADDVPVIKRDGASIRAVLGSSNGATSPLTPPTPVRVIDVALQPGARIVQDLSTDENAFLIVLDGEVRIAGAAAATGAVMNIAPGAGDLPLSAGPDGARFTLFAGRPLRTPRVQGGPFVASDADQLQRFRSGFIAGKFGTLIPFASQPDWAPSS